MQSYDINVNYIVEQDAPKTSPKYQSIGVQRTRVATSEKKTNVSSSFSISPRKAMAMGLATAYKVNQYVGELTENTVRASRNRTGLSLAGIGLVASKNPIAGGIAAAVYVGDRIAEYNIKAYKETLTSNFMKRLSGGTVGTGR